jgi:uncharacterized protein YoxC
VTNAKHHLREVIAHLRSVSKSLSEVNKALAVLEGQTLHSVRVAMRTLGHFTVTVETDKETVGESVDKIWQALIESGYIPVPERVEVAT